jgi:hypothetical protein
MEFPNSPLGHSAKILGFLPKDHCFFKTVFFSVPKSGNIGAMGIDNEKWNHQTKNQK